MTDVTAKNGRVILDEGCYEREVEHDVAEARTLAAALIAAADEADRQADEIKAACAEGHRWDGAYNCWSPGMVEKLCVRSCVRPGCRERQELPGWMEFAGRLHICPVTGQRLDCYGPGCEQCDMEALGRSARKVLTEGLRRMGAA